jgi:hypothetical protein
MVIQPRKFMFAWAFASLVWTGVSGAAEVLVTSDISVSTNWTANNVYNLQAQIYVLPGATLTIEAGTVIASTTDLGGSLAVTRGARIYINGTCDRPVIMTSTGDVATWDPDPAHPTGGNPRTGVWRVEANEWGNLAIMGRGLISASHFGGLPVGSNTKEPTGLNERQLEGLVAAFPGDPNVIFGGNDDNDNSGSISYLSLRYGGKVIGLGNELNGLALGGVGRETDIHHIDIMNGVDDGIEIWGGTVNLKYVNIWNIGDDSFDLDQGWRGKAQFGLIVQGYSAVAARGSGVCDNAFEADGAEDSDAQPITTSTIYNFTVVGQPLAGRGGTTWRDNARIQYRNCIFMELGQQLVRFDNVDGDGGRGYGVDGTLSWADTWTTPYTFRSPINAGTFTPGAFNDPEVLYTVQASGTLAEISDSVFYNNLSANAYTESNARGVTIGGGSNPAANNVVASVSPIQSLTRGTPVAVPGSLTVIPVTKINPLPANDALASANAAPGDGFFTPAWYRGAFSPNDNWIHGWTAASAFGFIESNNPTPTPTPVPVNDSSVIGTSIPGSLNTGLVVNVGITLANIGNTTWTAAGGFELFVVSDVCGLIAGAAIPLGPAESIPPNTNWNLITSLQAPGTPGDCILELQMRQNGAAFGPVLSRTVTITLPTNQVRDWIAYE